MKRVFIITVMTLCIGTAFPQVIPSDCTIPGILATEYEWDAKNLALRRIFELNSPDTALIAIPSAWQDTIMEGMAAILNLFAEVPEADSVFNLYCVHDKASAQYVITESIILMVDTSYAWTDAWQDLIALTGNPDIDALMTTYSLEVESFDNYSFGSMAVLGSPYLWNVYALIDAFDNIDGIMYGDPNYIIGAAGRIEYQRTVSDRFYDFLFQWNDCFDGCDNVYKWKFRVTDDCSVEYLGFETWGAFGIEPLPSPSNCNIYNAVAEETMPEPVAFPNPVTNILNISYQGEPDIYISLSDMQGREILKGNYTSHSRLNVSNLEPGLYILQLKDKNGQTTFSKLLKH